jgi:SPW repeat-containing protein
MTTTRRWQDYANLVFGCWLFLAPWIFATTSDPVSSWNAWFLGALIAIVALLALNSPANASLEWTNVSLGFWTLIAPWALGFSANYQSAIWDTAIVGVLVISVAYSALYALGHGTPTSTHTK